MNAPEPAAEAPGERSLLREWLMPARLFPLFLAIYLLTHILFLFRGQFTNDEGYFLYSSTLAMKGRIPYKDFAFWQPPPILYVYGLISEIFGQSLLGARAFSVLFGLIAFLLMAQVMKRRGSPQAVSILSILLVLNLSYAFDTSNVKTQSLAILIYMLAVFLAVCRPLTPWRCVLSSVLVALAAGTRIPLLVMIPFFWGLIYLESGMDRRNLLRSIAATLATLLGGFAVFYRISDGKVLFGLWGFYARSGPVTYRTPFPGEYVRMLFGDQMVCYAILAALLTCFLVLGLRQGALQRIGRRLLHAYRLEIFLAGSYLATSAVHLAAPVKYATHQNTNMPLLVMFLALVLGRWMQENGATLRTAFYSALVSLCVMSAMFQHAPLDGSGGKVVSEQFDNIAGALRRRIPEGGKLLTFLPIIAYEGRFQSLDGLTIGAENHFGAYGMTTEECLKYKGVDNRILYGYIVKRDADALVLTSWELNFMLKDSSGVTARQINDAVEDNYTLLARFEKVGQFENEALCWVRK